MEGNRDAQAATVSCDASAKACEQRSRLGDRCRDVVAEQALAYAKNDVEALDCRTRDPDAFAQPPAQAVAIDGARHRLASDHVADAAWVLRSGRGDQLQEARVVARAGRGNCGVARAPAAPSDGQAHTALGAACRQDLAAADRLHPGPKTVRARAAQLRRLIRAFHRGDLCGQCRKWDAGDPHAEFGRTTEKPYIRARYGPIVNATDVCSRAAGRRE